MVAINEQIACPLCGEKRTGEFFKDDRRNYLHCSVCGLVFVPTRHFLSPEDEKKRYDLHQNSPDDPGYRRFLNRLFIPLNHALAPGSCGLDFGSGPEPVLARMFKDAGHSVALFDLFYEPDPAAFEKMYDFITASEVVEHLREPGRELERLWQCLKPGGVLAIMTHPVVDADAISQWHYKNDLTHLCFFSPPVFCRLALHWNAELISPEKDVFLFRKPLR